MILVIDNYDSFVYNLVQYLGQLGAETGVRRNDQLTLDDIAALSPSHILISPGPCTPNEAGITLDLIERFAPSVPILGICLGHQAIGQVFGGRVIRAPYPVHGKTSLIHHQGAGVFAGLPSPLRATRYHSLIVDVVGLPECLEPTAHNAEGLIMGLRHKHYPVEGVQFHPESIMSEAGHDLLANFLRYRGKERTPCSR